MSQPPSSARFQTREEWLVFVAGRMEGWFTELGYSIPRYRVSIGFPSTGKRGKAVAECWDSTNSADNTAEILIRPDRADPFEVATDLGHEMVHCVVGLKAKHRGAFQRVALAIGFLPPMTTSPAGPHFVARITPILAEAGPLPHAALVWGGANTGPSPQKNRHVKMACPEPGCEYKARTSRKLIDEYGPALCPKHKVPMEVEGDSAELDDEDAVPEE